MMFEQFREMVNVEASSGCRSPRGRRVDTSNDKISGLMCSCLSVSWTWKADSWLCTVCIWLIKAPDFSKIKSRLFHSVVRRIPRLSLGGKYNLLNSLILEVCIWYLIMVLICISLIRNSFSVLLYFSEIFLNFFLSNCLKGFFIYSDTGLFRYMFVNFFSSLWSTSLMVFWGAECKFFVCLLTL